MIKFTKGSGQTSPFLIQFGSFLAGEGTGVTIAAINSFARVTGDVVLGTESRAPALTDANTSVTFWLSAGTADTTSVFTLVYTTSAGSTFDCRVHVVVKSSLQ